MGIHVVYQISEIVETIGLLCTIVGSQIGCDIIWRTVNLKEGTETVQLYEQQSGRLFKDNLRGVATRPHTCEGNLCRRDGVILVTLFDVVDG